MTRKQKYALFAGLTFTLIYWGFYNWITYGVNTETPEKTLAAFMYICFGLPAIGMTYDNTSND